MKQQISLLPGELWWGGQVAAAAHMPYPAATPVIDLHQHLGNQCAPLLLSDKGRYVWCDHPFSFQFADGQLIVDHPHGDIDFSEGHGALRGAYEAAMGKHFPPSGKLPAPINFTAPQYNTWIEFLHNPDQRKVLKYAHEIIEHDMPPGVFMIDDFWMIDYGNWTFHPGRFPDPKAMMDELHQLGFEVMLWVVPYMSPDNDLFQYLRRSGMLVRPKGSSHPEEVSLRGWWNGISAIVDYAKPEGRKWFLSSLNYLVDEYGVGGFKLDAGDAPYPNELPTYQNFVYEGCEHPSDEVESYAALGLEFPMNELRAGFKLGNQPIIWRQGDKPSRWDDTGLTCLIPNAIVQGLMGYSYNCPDMIGGGLDGNFSDPNFHLDSELYVRWAQLATLMPVMQFSLAPWKALKDEELYAVMACVRLREEMGPEILALAEQSAKDGLPMLRGMNFDHPEMGDIRDQYMLGEEILVAPVVAKGAQMRTVVFPKGIWQGDDGSIVSGPCSEDVKAPITRLPWYRKIG